MQIDFFWKRIACFLWLIVRRERSIRRQRMNLP